MSRKALVEEKETLEVCVMMQCESGGRLSGDRVDRKVGAHILVP